MSTTDDTELVRRLTATLEARAALVPPPGRFSPEPRSTSRALGMEDADARRGSGDASPDAPDVTIVRPRRPGPRALPRRRPAVLAATAAVVVAVGTAVVVSALGGPDPGGPDIRVGGAGVAPPAPDGVPAPTDPAPDGLVLWSVEWVEGPAAANRDLEAGYEAWAQLYSPADDPGAQVLLRYREPYPGYNYPPDLPDGPLVRGRETVIGDFHAGVADSPRQLVWEEGGLIAEAAYRGMTAEAAAALLDSLVARPGGAPGFDAPEDGTVRVVAEALGPFPGREGLVAEYTYGRQDAPPRNEAAQRSGSVTMRVRPPVGGPRFGYLEELFTGAEPRDDDGTIVNTGPAGVVVHRADGQEVHLLGPSPGGGVAREELAALAMSVRPVSGAELTRLWSEATARVAALPVVASVALPSGTVDVHRIEGGSHLLCLRRAEGTACPPASRWRSPALATGIQVGEAWYVLAAEEGRPPVVETPDLHLELGNASGWQVVLTRPPAGVDRVEVHDPDQDVGLELVRP